MAGPTNWIWDTSPECIQNGLPPGVPFSAEIMKPFEECTGFFTFGPGREYAFAGYVYPTPEGGSVGDIIYGGSAGIYTLTVLGFLVMLLAFAAWVWLEHRKLTDRAERLRAAAGPPTVGGGGSGG